jgi:hypothetical protein
MHDKRWIASIVAIMAWHNDWGQRQNVNVAMSLKYMWLFKYCVGLNSRGNEKFNSTVKVTKGRCRRCQFLGYGYWNTG